MLGGGIGDGSSIFVLEKYLLRVLGLCMNHVKDSTDDAILKTLFFYDKALHRYLSDFGGGVA
jgi:hypothetical protein